MKRNAARRLAVMLCISVVFQSMGGSVFSGYLSWFLLPGMISEARERPIPGDTADAVTATPGNAQTEDKEPDKDTASPSDAVVKVYGFSGEEEWLTVALGTEKGEIPFPDSVIAVVSEDEEEVIEGISWINRGSYDPDTPGVYEFELRLPMGYRLMSGVRLPVLYVCTGDHLITGLEFTEGAKKELHVMTGTKESDLELPETLKAAVCGTNEMEIPVTWKCEGVYDPETEGEYLFKAVPGEEYHVATGVKIPEAEVILTGAKLFAAAYPTPKISITGTKSEFPYRNDISMMITVSASVTPSIVGIVGEVDVTIRNADSSIISTQSQTVELGKSVNIIFEDPRNFIPFGNDDGNLLYYIDVNFQPRSNIPLNPAELKSGKTFKVINAKLVLHDKSKFTGKGTYEDPLGKVEILNGDVIIEGTKINVPGQWKWKYSQEELETRLPITGNSVGYNVEFIMDKTTDNQTYGKYYNPPEVTTLKPVIAKKLLWFVDPPELEDKYYNGTSEGKVKELYIRKSENGPCLKAEEALIDGTSTITSTVVYTDMNAGQGKTAKVTAKLEGTNINYAFNDKGSTTAEQTVKNCEIFKNPNQPVVTPAVKTYEIYAGDREVTEPLLYLSNDDKSVPNQLFTLTIPSGIGGKFDKVTMSYYAPTENAVKIIGKDFEKRTLTVKNIPNVETKIFDEVEITFESTNFQPVTAKLRFEVVKQKEPAIFNPPTSNNKIRSRQTLREATEAGLSLSGTAKDPDSTTTVNGKWTWKEPDKAFPAGTHNIAWVFTPDSKYGNKYSNGEGTISVTVAKSAAVFDPLFSDNIKTTKQTYPYGTTLGDILIIDGNDSTEHWKFTNPNTVPPRGSKYFKAEYKPSDPNDFESTTRDVMINIEPSEAMLEGAPPEATGIYGKKITEYEITNNPGIVVSDGKRLEGTWVWDTDNMDINSIPEVGGTKSYPAKFKIKTNPDYYTEVKVDIIPNVSPRNLQDITKVTLKQKIYDGTPIGAVEAITCRSSDKKTVNLNPSDYTYRVVYDNHNAGKNRSAMVYIRSNTPNYTIMREDGEMFYEVKGAVIEKSAVMPEILPDTLTCYANMDEAKTIKTTFDLNQFVPVAKPGETTGEVTYTISPISTTVGKYTVDKKGILTITAQKWDGGDPEDKVRVYVDTENYQQATVELYVKGTHKQVPVITEPMTYSSKVGAGQPLSRLKLNESIVFLDKDGKPVPGTVQWKEPGKVFEPGVHSAEWIFIPEDQEKYVSIVGTLTFTVEESNFNVTVNNGTGGGSYAEGAIVEILASIPADHAFLGWTGSPGVNFTDASKAATTFVMPARDVTVTGNSEYRPSFAVTVENGEGAGTYFVGETVTITAKAPSSKDNFYSWTSPQGVVFKDAYSAETTFVMPEMAVTVT
ncbi:MAG: hypothetical protein LUH21_26265, partial [Clostridiales bacterium]|nr:hypothetical protein [Clostridiales bacterium]